MPVSRTSSSLQDIGHTINMHSNVKLSSVCTSNKLYPFAKNRPGKGATNRGLNIPVITGTATYDAFQANALSSYESTYKWTLASVSSPYHLKDFKDASNPAYDYPVWYDHEGFWYTSSWEGEVSDVSDAKQVIPGGYIELENHIASVGQHIDINASSQVQGLVSVVDFFPNWYLGAVVFVEETEGGNSFTCYCSGQWALSEGSLVVISTPTTIGGIYSTYWRVRRAYPVLFQEAFTTFTVTTGTYGGSIIPINGKVVKVGA